MSVNLRASASVGGTQNTYDNILTFSSFGGLPSASGATNSSAITSFNTAYAALTGRTQLIIDPGTYNFSSGVNFGTSGGDRLTISAYGSTIVTPGGSSNGFANSGPNNDNTHNAKFTTASAGASTVSLITSGQTSLFTVGKWVLVTGIDMQGFGYPMNDAIFEFKKIQSIGTGTITFTEPLINSYKSTWPTFSPGDGVNIDQGGPGNIYVLRDPWDQEVELKGAFIADNSNLFYGKTRVAKYTDCTFETYGPCPTVNILFRATRCIATGFGGLEVDKVVHRAEFIDSTIRAIDFQSASVNEVYASNLSQPSGRWRGGGKNNTLINISTTLFNFGPMNYGAQGITAMTNVSASTGDWFSSNIFPFSDYTEEGSGVLSYAGGPNPASNTTGYWAVPGNNCVLLDASNGFARSFQVSDVSSSGGKTFVTTNLPFPVPSTINGKSSPWRIANHPCYDLTMVNCTGNSLFTSQSSLPAHSPFSGWTL
jgi:hypothetical protein